MAPEARNELTDYEKYIRTSELLALQKAPADLACHDELQFQIVHQVAELWMKLVAHELGYAVQLIGADRLADAVHTMHRVHGVQRLLINQLDQLDTMSPRDYMTIRAVLGRGSGQESPGFRQLLRLPGETVWPAAAALLARRGVTLRQIYDDQRAHAELYHLCEGLTDFDQLLQAWRARHLMLVHRIIGVGTPSLKGKPSELLERGMKQRFFPELWDVRDEVFAEWTKSMHADTGYHG